MINLHTKWNIRRAIHFLCIFSLFLLAACSDAGEDQAQAQANAKDFSLKEYLCAIDPKVCHEQLMQKLYMAPPDSIYERKLGGKQLHIPFAYLDYIEFLADPRYKKDEENLYLVSLLPEMGPRTPQNLREYFSLYEISAIHISVEDRSPESTDWIEGIELARRRELNGSNNPVRRPNKYGLEIWGEDFDKWPRRLPCPLLVKDTIEKPCGRPSTPNEVYTPIGARTSLLICAPEAMEDRDAQIAAMPETEREAYFKSNIPDGIRRAMCYHRMYYAPLNAGVTLTYPRRFVSQWQKTEERVRAILDSFLVPEQPEGKQY